MNILIVKLGALGDVLRTTSILRPLRRKYRAANIAWLTSKPAEALLQTNPLIDTVCVMGGSVPAALTKHPWDLIVSLEEDAQACRWVNRIRAREIVGAYLNAQGRPVYTASSAPWFDMGVLNRGDDGSLDTANRLKKKNTRTYPELLARILGLSLARYPQEYRPILVLNERDRRANEEFRNRHGIGSRERLIGINLGSGTRWLSKQPSVETTVQWIRMLHQRFGRRMILLGGPDEVERNRAICERSGVPLMDAGTGHTICGFASLIDLCELVVTADTLALHLASALRKKIVAVFGPTSPAEIELYGDGVKLLPPKPCRCYYRPRCRIARHFADRITG